MTNDSVGTRFWSGGIRLSLLAFTAIMVVLFAVLLAIGTIWWRQGRQLVELDARTAILEHDVQVLTERGEWTLRYYRIQKGIDVLGLRKVPPAQKQKLAEKLWQLSRDFNFDPLIILAMVAHESRGNPYARGQFQSGAYSGAVGLMQIKSETAKEMADAFGIKIVSDQDLLRPEINLLVGTLYVAKLMVRYGNAAYAIMAYNVGPGDMDSRLRNRQPLPIGYHRKVMGAYHRLINQLDDER